MNAKEVKEIINSEISKFLKDNLDNEIKKILHNPNSKSRDEMILSIKNAMESVYKVLWQKKDFWKNDIK